MIHASHPERFATCGNLHLGVSEHDLVFAVRKNKLAKPKAREIEYQSIRRFLTGFKKRPLGYCLYI